MEAKSKTRRQEDIIGLKKEEKAMDETVKLALCVLLKEMQGSVDLYRRQLLKVVMVDKGQVT